MENMARGLNKIESFLFFVYIVLATSFYGFKGFTYIPQLVGIVLALFYIFKLIILHEKSIISTSQKLLIGFFLFLSISLVLFFPSDKFFIESFIQFIILFHVSINIIGKRGEFRNVLYAFILGIAILIYNRVQLSESILNPFSLRIGSTAGNQNDYGLILACGTILLLYELLRNSNNVFKQIIIWLSIIVLQVESFIYAGSRTTIAVSFVAILFFFLYQLFKSSFLNKFLIVSIATYLVISLGTILPDLNTFQRIISLSETMDSNQFSTQTSSGQRLGFIKEGIRLWIKSPLWGHGSNRFRHINRVKDDYYSHNNYIELLSNNGLIGFALFYGIHAFLFYQINRKWSRPKPKHLWWLNVILLCLLMTDMGFVSYYHKIYLLMLAFVSGMIIYYRRYAFQKHISAF